MPTIVFESIHSCSSQDTKFPANNLLHPNAAKKWKCAGQGEPSAFVILRLATPIQITAIDIGNEHSAFIEVLVGNTRAMGGTFKEILLTSSFMTPMDSRSSSNPNRVRCFAQNALVEHTSSEKWDLIKVFCTQPFNRHVQYGLSFIIIHSSHAGQDEKVPSIGNFQFRNDSPESDLGDTSLFNRWKQTKTTASSSLSLRNTLKRTRSPVTLVEKPFASSIQSPVNHNLKSIINDGDDNLSYAELNKPINENKTRSKKEQQEQAVYLKKPKPGSSLKTEDSSKELSSCVQENPKVEQQNQSSSLMPIKTSAKKPKLFKELQLVFKPFKRLLEDVVFVISGIQNPERAVLRQKAIEMGARYKADWVTGCTHLICAYKNTPKYIQVHGSGKIIKRNWIEDCYTQKKLLPWRKYALDSAESNKPDSEDEIVDDSYRPLSIPKPTPTSSKSRKQEDTFDEVVIKAMYDQESCSYHTLSGSDTEDEIDRVISKQKKGVANKVNSDNDASSAVYDKSTDEDGFSGECKPKTTDPLTFFESKQFLLCDQLGAVDRIKLKNEIERFYGKVTLDTDIANYFITNDFNNAPQDFPGEVLKPVWIYECTDMESFIPTKRYKFDYGK